VGTFREPEIVSEVLAYALEGEELGAGEVVTVLAGLFAAEEDNAMLLLRSDSSAALKGSLKRRSRKRRLVRLFANASRRRSEIISA
jgi:hypothetical protein